MPPMVADIHSFFLLHRISFPRDAGLRTIVPSFAEVAKDLQNVYCQGEERRMSQAVKGMSHTCDSIPLLFRKRKSELRNR